MFAKEIQELKGINKAYISAAAKSVGAKDLSAIRNACIGKTNSSFGFIWKFK